MNNHIYPHKKLVRNSSPPGHDYKNPEIKPIYIYLRPQINHAPHYFSLSFVSIPEEYLNVTTSEEEELPDLYYDKRCDFKDPQDTIEQQNDEKYQKEADHHQGTEVTADLIGSDENTIEDGELIEETSSPEPFDDKKSEKKMHRKKKKEGKHLKEKIDKSSKLFGNENLQSVKEKYKERKSYHKQSHSEREKYPMEADGEVNYLKNDSRHDAKTSSKDLVAGDERLYTRKSKHSTKVSSSSPYEKPSSSKSSIHDEYCDSDSERTYSKGSNLRKEILSSDEEFYSWRSKYIKDHLASDSEESRSSKSMKHNIDAEEPSPRRFKKIRKTRSAKETIHSYLRSDKLSIKQEVVSDDEISDSIQPDSQKDASKERSEPEIKQEVCSKDEGPSKRILKTESISDDENSSNSTSKSARSHRSDRRYDPRREVKREINQEPDNYNSSCIVIDDFYCSVCKLNLNSETTWDFHMKGKKHAKALKALSIYDVVKSTVQKFDPVSEDAPRHDKPAPGRERIQRFNAKSQIQAACDDVSRPLVGLEYMWEINSDDADTLYYCSLCDAPCAYLSIMPHLTGYKHQLRFLKEKYPSKYERVKDMHKKNADPILSRTFYEYESRHGRGKIKVFDEVPLSHSAGYNRHYDQPGCSWQSVPPPPPSVVKSESLNKTDEISPTDDIYLDTSFNDFRCIVCDAHMNNIGMWESHVKGKRHLKNLKKNMPGEVIAPSSNKNVPAPPGTRSHLDDLINVKCPDAVIVGLDFIREIRGENGDRYSCYACGGCFTDIDIIEHLLCLKHKIIYLEKLSKDGKPNDIQRINELQLTEEFRTPLIEAECIKIIELYGRGKAEVFYPKSGVRF